MISSSGITCLFFFITRRLKRLDEKRAGKKAKKTKNFRGKDWRDQFAKGRICELIKKKLFVKK